MNTDIPLAEIISGLWRAKNPLMTTSQLVQYIDAVHYLQDEWYTVKNANNPTIAAVERPPENAPTVCGRRPAA